MAAAVAIILWQSQKHSSVILNENPEVHNSTTLIVLAQLMVIKQQESQ